MKIDLHCHTMATKKNESKKRNVSVDLFKEKTELAEVGIVAITNHNRFFRDQYDELLEKSDCQVWPGIELDVASTVRKSPYHLVLVANPDQVDLFDNATTLLTGTSTPDECVSNISTVIEAVKGIDVFFIPHYPSKSKFIPAEDEEVLRELIVDPRCLFVEPSDFRSMGVYANHDYNVIIGSDVQDWETYEKCTLPELRLPVTGFQQLKLLTRRESSVVASLLREKDITTYAVSPHEGVYFDLDFYNDINVLFGQKGTGKSEILASIERELRQKGIPCVFYVASKRSESFDALLSTNDMDRSASSLNADNCKDLFTDIDSWNDFSPAPLKGYLDWWRTKDSNKNKARMKITAMDSLGTPDEEVLIPIKSDKESTERYLVHLTQMDINHYLDDDDGARLIELLEKLNYQIHRSLTRAFIGIEAIKLANFTIDAIKNIADAKSETRSKPSSTGFEAFANGRIDLMVAARKIRDNFAVRPVYSYDYIGSLEGKGEVYLRTTHRFLCDKSNKKEYPGTITKLKNVRKNMEALFDASLGDDILNAHAEFKKCTSDNGIISLDDFVGLSKEITLEKEEYTPSNGEKGILLLQMELSKDVPVYILDEPELGMGNSYIEKTIRTRLVDLGRQGKTVIIATHNANIAVRTLPCVSVYREHVNGNDYRTYSGNPFTDSLIDITDADNTLSWTKTSLETLEGGFDAFYEREFIYGTN